MNNFRGILLKSTLPVLIGLSVVAWLFVKDFNWDDWKDINWSYHVVIALILAFVALIGREFGLMWRFRVLSDKRLNWMSSFRVTLLCEFTSAITPTTAGGSALSMVFMSKEGVSSGRATTITLTTFLLDEAFFVLMCPLIFILVGKSQLFGFDLTKVESGIRAAYWIVWGGIVLITALLFVGILIKPHVIRNILLKLFSFGKLKKWFPKVDKLTAEMITTSCEIKDKSYDWWFKACSATVISWFSRFMIVNALFYAFAEYASQIVVFARQTVVWTLLTVSPTPGGSGVSEWLFTTYYGDLLNDVSIALVIALFWRIITYYIYLAIGITLLPSWIRKPRINKYD
ncbi:MAG: flippase-like domain-containing protein [Paramuribaculum sp.]|nr:flippase-like domain-containing protein [Paramuribaculum sp.]